MRISVSVIAAVLAANPIRKVVTLLQDLQKEIEAEGEKEEDLYNKFQCYCKGNTDNLSTAGTEAAAQIEALSAKVKQETAEKKQVGEELAQHKKERTSAKQDLEKATKIREKEHTAYIAAAGDTQSNIDSTNAAVKALEKGAGSFLQTKVAGDLKNLVATATVLDSSDREAIDAFLQQSGDYVPQGGQIIGILKNMKDEFDKSLGGIVSDEEAAAKDFTGLKAAKTREIQAATEAIESKTQRVGELAVSIVQNENAKEDATRELDDSQKFLANLDNTCKEKATDYEERTKTRQEEIVAISEAVKVLNDDNALDIFKSAIPSKGQTKPSFLERKSTKNNGVQKAKALIAAASAAKYNSPAVALLAHTVASKLNGKSGVDFSTVIKMIDDMITLLGTEQKDDEKHRDFCNAEFDSSDDEQKAEQRKLASLVSSISELNDEIASIKEQVAAHNAEVAALDKSVTEATAQRKAEHEEYTQKVQLNEAAIQLIFKATNKLNQFYNPSQHVPEKQRELTAEDRAVIAAGGEVDRSISFVQVSAHVQGSMNASAAPPPPPETYGEYKSKGQKSNGVIALMGMLSKDLEKEIQESEHIEKTANRDYTELIADAQESKAQNIKSITDKNGSAASLETKLQETKNQHIITKDSLAQIANYISDLHNSCDFITQNFEVRREARTNEIEGLKNAKAVLSGAGYN
jgi:septal ring factor EnvC (AmiA/AmiB activator)